MTTNQDTRPRGLPAIGTWCWSHPTVVITVWILLLLGAWAGAAAAGGSFDDTIDLPGSQVSEGADLLSESGGTGGSGQIVFHQPDGGLGNHATEIAESLAALEDVEGVIDASDPFDPTSPSISADGTTAYTTVRLTEQPRALGEPLAEGVTSAMESLDDVGVEVSYASVLGEVIEDAERGHTNRSELIGLAVALVVLLIAFGSVAGALIPIITAVMAAALGLGILELMTSVVTFNSTAPVLATMIGLGVGIDYGLFLITRYRQDLMDGVDPRVAIARTAASSGHSVLVAGGTVAIALLGLYVSGIPFIGALGLASVFTVLTALLAAMTLVPAALGVLGRRVDRFSLGTPKAEPRGESGSWYRYSRRVSRRPWTVAIASSALLLLMAVPVLTMQLGHVYDGAAPEGSTTRVAYDRLAEGFGPGINATMTVVVDTEGLDDADAASVADRVDSALKQTDGIERATPLTPESDTVYSATVIPTTGPDEDATTDLFVSLRDAVLPGAADGTAAETFVTGTVPGNIEFTERVSERLVWVIIAVVLLSFILLMATFRSVAIAVKAALMNLISIGASYGVIVAVFQWQWGSSLLGIDQAVPIEAFVPMMMFAVIFGLSMDYEVFLVSRIREAWQQNGDTTKAVGAGLAASARVITAAALIMISVFLSFVGNPDVAIKMLSIGLAVSVLLDATLVRLLLVPSSMALMGRYNWWIPRWLDRILPHVEPEPLPPIEHLADSGANPAPTREVLH